MRRTRKVHSPTLVESLSGKGFEQHSNREIGQYTVGENGSKCSFQRPWRHVAGTSEIFRTGSLGRLVNRGPDARRPRSFFFTQPLPSSYQFLTELRYAGDMATLILLITAPAVEVGGLLFVVALLLAVIVFIMVTVFRG